MVFICTLGHTTSKRDVFDAFMFCDFENQEYIILSSHVYVTSQYLLFYAMFVKNKFKFIIKMVGFDPWDFK